METSHTTPPTSNPTQRQLIEIARWAKYLAIIGLIGMVGVLIQNLTGPIISSLMVNAEGRSNATWILLLYLMSLIKLVYIYPLYQLLQFSNTMLAVEPNQEKALVFLNGFFKWLILCSLLVFASGLIQSGFGLFSMFWMF